MIMELKEIIKSYLQSIDACTENICLTATDRKSRRKT